MCAGPTASVPASEDELWRFFEEHPLCVARRVGHSGAIKLSDFQTQSALHRTWAYDIGFAPFEIEYQLNVSIPSPPWRTKTFLFNRSRGGRDFTGGTGSYSTYSSRIWRGSGTGQGRVGSSGRHYRVWDRHPSGTRAG